MCEVTKTTSNLICPEDNSHWMCSYEQLLFSELAEGDFLLDEPRKRHPKIVTVPRTLNSDIRRSFAEMFVIAMNTNNIYIVESFFNTFTMPNMIMFEELKMKDKHVSKQFHGRNLCLQVWYNRFHASTDTVFQISDVKVHTYSHTKDSKVTFEMHIHGTRTLDIHHRRINPSKDTIKKLSTEHLPHPSSTSCNTIDVNTNQDTNIVENANATQPSFACSNKSSKEVIDTTNMIGVQVNKKRKQTTYVARNDCPQMEYDTSIIDVVNKAKLLPTPIPIHIYGIFSMFLNANKEIMVMTY